MQNQKKTQIATTVDCHVHVWPDSLVQRNLETIKNKSGISPAFDGSISSLHESMGRSGMTISIVNNLVLRADLVKKANDWTALTVSRSRDLVGMGWVIAGLPESVEEARRCISELNFKGVKMHHSHSKIFPDDSKNYPIYEKLSELGVPVLFHCGKNPYTNSSEVQFSAPWRFRQVLSSFNKLKVVMGHLAGFEDYPEEALDLLTSFSNASTDTAIEFTTKVDVKEIVKLVGVDKILFGSDYPIRDPSTLLSWLNSSLPESDVGSILSDNPRKLFAIA